MKLAALLATALAVGCKGAPARDEPTPNAREPAAPGAQVALDPPAERETWPELAGLPRVDPLRVISLPARRDVPRFEVGGPAMVGDLAVVASSQFGFAAVDVRRGQLVWTKPAGRHVAPPLATADAIYLIGDCLTAPELPDGELLLGCLRVVTPVGTDRAYLAIRGRTARVGAFAASAGSQQVWPAERGIVWRRGDLAVAVDAVSGAATPASAAAPPLEVRHGERRWQVTLSEDGQLDARGEPPWRARQTYGALVGAVYLPGQSPMVRVTHAERLGDRPAVMVTDLDATGSLGSQTSISPAPGIGLVGHACSTVGDVALAVRLDTSLERHYIAGYAANAMLVWTYPLPRVPRPDPVGVAMTADAVVVFHDGDTLTVLPEVSAPPTAPGAVRAASENPTP
jgi:hypothetical protein